MISSNNNPIPLPGGRASTPGGVTTTTPRPGAPARNDPTMRTPIFDKDVSSSSGGGSSFPYSATRQGGYGTSQRPQQQQQEQQRQQLALDQEEWSRRFPAASPSAHLRGMNSHKIAAAVERGQLQNQQHDTFMDRMAGDAARQKRLAPAQSSQIDRETHGAVAASLLPGDRAVVSFAPAAPTMMLPWVPGQTEQFLRLQEQQKMKSFLQASAPFTSTTSAAAAAAAAARLKRTLGADDDYSDNDGDGEAASAPVPLGTRVFTVNVVTDPLRVGTAGPAEEEARIRSGFVPSADAGASPAASTSFVLQNLRATSVRHFAQQIEKRLAAKARIFMSIQGFRYSNLMQTDPWMKVSSLVGDEMLRQDHGRGLGGSGGGGAAMSASGMDSPVARGARSAHAAALFGSFEESERIFTAVSSAAARAAGSISFGELPAELTIVPFVAKRRLAFTVTCTNITPAGVSVFPLKESDVLLERRGSAWIGDMETLRAAISKVTHRDCSATPLFLMSTSVVPRQAIGPIDAQFESLPKCELIVGPHQLPTFSSILVTVPSSFSSSLCFRQFSSTAGRSGGQAFELPDELGNVIVGVSKRIKTPLAAGLVVNAATAHDHELLRSQQQQYAKNPMDLSGIPLKREEILSPDRTSRSGSESEATMGYHNRSNNNNSTSNGDVVVPASVADLIVDASKYKQTQKISPTDLVVPRVGLNLIEHVIAEGMARFGDYIQSGSIRTPNVVVRRYPGNAAGTGTGSSSSGGADENDPERSLLGVDESSKALLFASDINAAIAERPLRQYEVPKARFRRALLQASMHFLRAIKDQEVLSMDALVRSTSDVVDVVMRELETRFGFGQVRAFMLPLGQHEIEAIKIAANRAVQLEIAVASSAVDSSLPFTKSHAALHRVNAERKLMGLAPLDPTRAGVGGPGGSNFMEVHADSPGIRALRAAREGDQRYHSDERQQQQQQRRTGAASSPSGGSGGGDTEAEVASRLGMSTFEPAAPRKPLGGAVLVLTRPQFDLVTKRLVFFATCSVDIFSIQSAVIASRFHRRNAQQLQKTSEAAYFRWCFAYGQVSSDQFRDYLRNKDEGAPPPRMIREVPLDALIELSLARVDIVSFSRPTTLALEISLQRAPTSVDFQQQQSEKQKNGSGDSGNVGLGQGTGDSTMDILQADERYSIYVELGDDDGGIIHQAVTFILPSSVLHPERFASDARRKDELRRGGQALPKFDEVSGATK